MAPPLTEVRDIQLQLTTHLSTPRRMKGWVGLVGWPIADGLPHKWSPVSYRSSAGQEKFDGRRPTFYRCATQPTGTTSKEQNWGTTCAWDRLPCSSPTRTPRSPSTMCIRCASFFVWMKTIVCSRNVRFINANTVQSIHQQTETFNCYSTSAMPFQFNSTPNLQHILQLTTTESN